MRSGRSALRVSRKRRRDVLLAVIGRLHRTPGGAPLARRIERRVVERLARDLFDDSHWRRVERAGDDAFDHWLRHAGRSDHGPNAWFDPVHYRQQVRRWPTGVNPLAHWALRGRHRGLSPWPGFEPARYARLNPDVSVAKLDPYRHFALHGAREGRPLLSPAAHGAWASDGATSSVDEILLENHAPPVLAEIGVVIPVYRDLDLTLAAIRNALRPAGVPHVVVVVDDATPEPDLREALDRLAGAGLITLLRNDANRGFVASANRGLAARPDGDVVLLNSDALVFGDWLARLSQAATPGVASVTPLTNNGTICSYPVPNRDRADPLETPFDELDALTARVNEGEVVEVPVGVGFCMLMTRRALDAVGPLDERAFGAGYGEEADWSLRARAAGLRNVVAANTMVLHMGARSFGTKRGSRLRAADVVLERRWPRHPADVAAHNEADPLRPARERLDEARLRRGLRGGVLLITHRRGGGIEQCVQGATRKHGSAGRDVFRLDADDVGRPVLQREGVDTPNLERRTWQDLPRLLDDLKIRSVEIHSLADFDPDTPGRLRRLLADADLPFTVHLHDYLPVCPRINLVDENALYCGEPDEAGCRACLRRRGSAYGAPDIAGWRRGHHALLHAAQAVIAPDEDVARRFQRRWPEVAITVQPHERVSQAPPPPDRPAIRPYRIVTIGAVTPIKGLHTLRAVASFARTAALPLEFHVLGTTSDDVVSHASGLHLAGPYTNGTVGARLAALNADAVFLPSTWPETFAFTMSHALRSGLPVIVFDLGAQATRLPDNGRNMKLSLDLAKSPMDLCHLLLAHLDGLAKACASLDHGHMARHRRHAAPVQEHIAVAGGVTDGDARVVAGAGR